MQFRVLSYKTIAITLTPSILTSIYNNDFITTRGSGVELIMYSNIKEKYQYVTIKCSVSTV